MKSYKFITAYSFCCVPALLEIIIHSEIEANITQLDIANFLGLNIPNAEHECLIEQVSNVNYIDDPNKYGVILDKDSLPSLFRAFHLPFGERYISISTLTDWEFIDIVEKYINDDHTHLIVGLDYGKLYHNHSNAIGHVLLLLDYQKLGDIVTCYDPGPKNSGIKQFSIYDIFSAIHAKHDGVWIIYRV